MVKQLTFNLQNGDRYPGLRPSFCCYGLKNKARDF